MNKKVTWFVLMLIPLFTWQTIAEAASISSRVRILESKVKKQTRAITRETLNRKKDTKALKRDVKEIAALREQVDMLMRIQKREAKKRKRTYVPEERLESMYVY